MPDSASPVEAFTAAIMQARAAGLSDPRTVAALIANVLPVAGWSVIRTDELERPEGTIIEWGLRRRHRFSGADVVIGYPSEETARQGLPMYRHSYPEAVVVRRDIGPWTEAPATEPEDGEDEDNG